MPLICIENAWRQSVKAMVLIAPLSFYGCTMAKDDTLLIKETNDQGCVHFNMVGEMMIRVRTAPYVAFEKIIKMTTNCTVDITLQLDKEYFLDPKWTWMFMRGGEYPGEPNQLDTLLKHHYIGHGVK